MSAPSSVTQFALPTTLEESLQQLEGLIWAFDKNFVAFYADFHPDTFEEHRRRVRGLQKFELSPEHLMRALTAINEIKFDILRNELTDILKSREPVNIAGDFSFYFLVAIHISLCTCRYYHLI